MKKTYIIPNLKWQEMSAEVDLLGVSTIGSVNGADITVGDKAGDGTSSDSRRFTVWDDEDY
jgi:hypothetical protein